MNNVEDRFDKDSTAPLDKLRVNERLVVSHRNVAGVRVRTARSVRRRAGSVAIAVAATRRRIFRERSATDLKPHTQ